MRNKEIPASILSLWGHDGPYNDYSRYMKKRFGQRVQKISLDAGVTCPNRDGTIGTGGCSYCRVSSFVPAYVGKAGSLQQQIDEGIAFFRRKYDCYAYAAYFQSYTTGYGDSDRLMNLFEEALRRDDICSLIVSTRPDCIDETLARRLAALGNNIGKPVFIEIGIESTSDRTLERINRGHTFARSAETVRMLDELGIECSAHLILGLPGETEEVQTAHAAELNALPLRGLKIHHLQILKGTQFADRYPIPDLELYTKESYIDFLCGWIPLLRPDIVIERFINEAPREMIIAPDWGGVKNYAFVNELVRELSTRGLYQGMVYRDNP